MKAFMVYPTYRVENGKAKVHIYGRLENGDTFLSIHDFRPYFYIRTKDLKEARKLAKNMRFDSEKTDSKNFDDEKVTKITMDNPRNVTGLRDLWHDEEIPTYEADVRFVYRFLIDHNIRGSFEIKGKHKEGNEKHRVDRVYENPEIKPTEWTPELKTLAIDIETDKDNGDLWAISFYTEGFKKCLIKKKGEFKDAESFDNEKELLERFRELFLEIDPDILTGWNVIDFDLDFLEAKFKEYNLPFDLGRSDDKCTLRRYEAFMRDSTADFPGRQVLDGMHLLRISFISLENNKLDTAAKEFVDDEKLIEGPDKYEQIRDAYENNPQELVNYNIKDSVLAYDVIHESGVLDLTIQRSLIAGMQLDRVKASVASLDNLYLAELKERKRVADTRHYARRERRITGGYVLESKSGIYDYVIVCDFKSLYPSIMLTFNIDPLSFVPEEKEGKNLITAPNGARFKKETGIIPDLLKGLWERRNQAKKEKNILRSNAIKVLMNSIFGVLANPNCRFYSFEMANAITTFGQHFLKLTAEKIREKGYDVIYGDTDSIFIDLDVENYDKAKKIGGEIQDSMNDFFEGSVEEEYGVESFLELEYEKTYKRFFMPKIRGKESGAKKRYAGLVEDDDGVDDIDFVGLEFVRRDWTDLAKTFQKTLLQKVFDKEEPNDFIIDFVEKLKEGKMEEKLLIYRKALRKAPEDYVKTTPPHVKAARKMEEVDSNIIEYILTVDGPEPADDLQHTIDYDHYVEKQIKPLANQVLTFYNTKFDDVLKGTKQTRLGGF